MAKVERPSYGEVLACGEEGAAKVEAESPSKHIRCEKCGTYVQVIWCSTSKVAATATGKPRPSSLGKSRGAKLKQALSRWFTRSDRSR